MPILKKRRKMIVNRELQFDILMYVGLLISSLFVMQIMTASIFLHQFDKIAESMTAMEFIARYKISFLIYQSISFGICMVFGVFIFNRFSSRIAGPLFNMRRALRQAEVSPDQPVVIRLREDDYFQAEIDDVNAMLKRKYW